MVQVLDGSPYLTIEREGLCGSDASMGGHIAWRREEGSLLQDARGSEAAGSFSLIGGSNQGVGDLKGGSGRGSREMGGISLRIAFGGVSERFVNASPLGGGKQFQGGSTQERVAELVADSGIGDREDSCLFGRFQVSGVDAKSPESGGDQVGSGAGGAKCSERELAVGGQRHETLLVEIHEIATHGERVRQRLTPLTLVGAQVRGDLD
jgi:hypothetical protein